MTMRTGILITGDTEGAQKAVADLAAGMGRASASAENMAASERQVDSATDALEAKLRRALGTVGALNDNFMANAGAARSSAAAQGEAERAATGLFAAEQRLEAALSSREAAQRRATAATAADADEQEAAAGALAAANARVATAVLGVEKAHMAVTRAGGATTRSMGEQQLGARMLGQQLQDMAVMGSMAGDSLGNWLRVFTSQIGQTSLALEQMGAKGALGEAAAFMNTPWGAAVTGAAIVLLPLVANLLEAGSGAAALEGRLDDAAKASDAFGDAQNMLAKIVDLTTGKLKTQNLVLVESIKLQAQLNILKAQEKIDAAAGNKKPTGDAAFDALGENDLRRLGGPRGDVVYAQQQAAASGSGPQVAALRDLLIRQINNDALAQANPSQYASVVGGQLSIINDQLDAMAQNGKVAGKSLIEVKTEFLELANAGVQKAANMEVMSAATTGIIPDDLKKDAKTKRTRTPKGKSTASRDEFGRDAADRIAGIAESFSETPDAIQKADKAIRSLDDTIDDLSRRKPPNFEGLIDKAEAAKHTIEAGLIRSIAEAFEAPKTLADKAAAAFQAYDQLIAAEAAKLKKGLISAADFDVYSRQIEAGRRAIQEGLTRPYTQFVESQQDALRIQELITRGRYAEAEALRQIIQLEKMMGPLDEAHRTAILASVQALQAEQHEADVLRQIRQKDLDALYSMRDIAREASQEFARGELGQLVKTPKKVLDAFLTLRGDKLYEKIFGPLFRDLEDEVNGTTVVKDASARMAQAVDAASSSIGKLGSAASQAAANLNGGGGAAGVAGGWASGVEGGSNALGLDDLFGARPGGDAQDEGNIVVSGTVKKQMDVFQRSIGGAVEKFARIFTDPENAKALGRSIGTYAGQALEGAAMGTMIAGVSNSLGIKMNNTGAQLGGAAGSFLPIPGGSIIGSIAGGLVGNLFSKPSYGTATLTNTNDAARLAGRAGGEIGAGGASEQVQSGLENIAKQLGGTLGNFAVSIGTFDGKWRVSTTGFSGQLDSKTARGQGLHDFGKDGEQAAIAFAIQDAIADGAIKGLSPAIQKAIRKYSDVDKSLEEALKVADLEQLLGGLPAELASQFKNFETEAAERLRIAQEYGFDIVKTEELNAKQRAALSKQLLDQQVGSLQKLIDEMTSGSMFEGTLVDQRTALLASIEKAKADLDNGVEGAADTLADLFGQLNAVSKDVYGTTGGFATDRSEILDQARAAIAAANARIAAAQQQANGTSDPALTTTNAALDENNDQNARMLSLLTDIKALLTSSGTTASDLSSLISLARVS